MKRIRIDVHARADMTIALMTRWARHSCLSAAGERMANGVRTFLSPARAESSLLEMVQNTIEHFSVVNQTALSGMEDVNRMSN